MLVPGNTFTASAGQVMDACGPTVDGLAQAPQSSAQVEQLSVPLQVPSPHQAHAPQSAAQVEQLSVASQTLSPQAGAG
jgi:hypothetical protein